uniref:FMR1 neighbor n=1 Tax=Cebus imitator TaxID=2715852 RepID=A0A2K5PQA8_CEBIM
MPSDQRKVKRRNRSRSRVAKVARLKKATSEAAASELNPESSHPGHEAAMGNRPRPGWRASLHGFRAQRFWLFSLSICILLLVYYYMYPGDRRFFLLLNGLKNSEDASGQSLGKDFALEALLNFFFPTTCIVRENQVVKACNELQELNESECLRQKCCFSSSGTGRFKCFAPLRDEPKQMMRMCGVGVVSLVSLGYLSFYCCSLCWRRSGVQDQPGHHGETPSLKKKKRKKPMR